MIVGNNGGYRLKPVNLLADLPEVRVANVMNRFLPCATGKTSIISPQVGNKQFVFQNADKTAPRLAP